jgi:hypothetical protein
MDDPKIYPDPAAFAVPNHWMFNMGVVVAFMGALAYVVRVYARLVELGSGGCGCRGGNRGARYSYRRSTRCYYGYSPCRIRGSVLHDHGAHNAFPPG